MNLSRRRIMLALLASLAAIATVVLSLYALETQASNLSTDNLGSIARVQDESLPHDWTITIVDDWGIVGWYTWLALEPTAPYTPHISYYASFPNYDLNYASWDGARWVTTTVDSKGIVGYHTSLALEPTSPYTPHISYYDYTNGDLKHAWLSGTRWLSETVDSEGNVGSYTSLALELTAPFVPHISYYDVTNKALKHAWLSGTKWLSETVDGVGTVGWYTSLALEPTAPYTPHISYRDATNRALKYASRNGTGWVSETVDSIGSVGWYTSLALEPTPPYNPHISYLDRTNYALKYASWNGTKWVSETVDYAGSVGWYTSLALETTTPYTPHISFYDFTDGDLKHAWLSSKRWLSETVDSEGNAGRYASIDLITAAASYTVCISYHDDTVDALKLACSEPPAPHLTVTKWADLAPMRGAPFTYTIEINNSAPLIDATGVVVTDSLPFGAYYVSGGDGFDGTNIEWNDLVVGANDTITVAFVVSTCQTNLTNEWYRVTDSDQGVGSDWGVPLTTLLTDPSIVASFTRTPPNIGTGETIYFTDTSTFDGSLIVEWAWDFGDSIGTSNLPHPTYTYDTIGAYTVTLTVTDSCGFYDSDSERITVTKQAPDIDVAPSFFSVTLNPSQTTTYTLIINNLGDGTLEWGPLTKTPDVDWLNGSPITGTILADSDDKVTLTFDSTTLLTDTYTTTLQVPSNDPDEQQVNISVTLRVTSEPICAEVTGVTLTQITTGAICPGNLVEFEADITPDDITTPYNYRITLDATLGVIMTSAVEPLVFTIIFATAGSHTVEIAAWNCAVKMTEAVASTTQVIVIPCCIYLPVVVKNF